MTYMETTETKKFSQKLTRWAIGVSVAYAGLLVCMVWVRFDKLPAMELNAIGDFLAGAFSPLAFFWLVVGYFQQGHELGQNTEALRLQLQEMSAAVEQQREQTAIFRTQLAEDRERFLAEKLPAFGVVCRNDTVEDRIESWAIDLTNHGAPCTDASLVIDEPGFWLGIRQLPHVPTGYKQRTSVNVHMTEISGVTPFSIHITYECVLGKRSQELRFVFSPGSKGYTLSHIPDMR